MNLFLNIAQLVVSVLLIISILLQSRGGGLGSLFGGGGEVYQTRRGIEKIIFYGTIVLAILFLSLGVIRLVIA